jgi:S-formylglutathione hydrolase
MRNLENCWTSEAVGGRPVEIFAPGEGFDRAVLFLHGADGRSFRGRASFETAFAERKLLVLCPAGGRSWWLDTVCSDFDPSFTPMAYLRGPLMEFLRERWGVSPPRIGVTGIGMGGQGALNLAFRHARSFPVVAAIAPDVDFHQWHGRGLPLDRMFPSREAARQQTAILHLHPLNWPPHMLIVCDPVDRACFEGTERLISKLHSTGIPFESDLTTSAGGHTWEYFDRMAPKVAQFLSEHLQ